jgi:hypothetical protein
MQHNSPDITSPARWCRNTYPPSPLCGNSIYSSNCMPPFHQQTLDSQLTPCYSSSLKYACPHGVFMSLTPGDPTLWSGVIFVRKGPCHNPSYLEAQRLTHQRPIRPRNPAIPNLLPTNIPLSPPSRNIQHRHFPSLNHTPNDLHVHDRYPRFRNRVCYR